MKLHAGLSKTLMNAAWLSMPFLASPQDQPLSLKHGVYVRENTPCKGAPNAAILFWDGIGFSGAHSSKCTSRVLRRNGTQFQITTACSALGDGSPIAPGHEDVDSFWLTRLSSTRFGVRKEHEAQGNYRWCSAKSVD
jgi:hypothetical protein